MQEKINVANHYAFLQNSEKGFLYDLKIYTQKTVQIAVSHQGRIYVPGHTVGCLYLLTVIQIPIFANLSPTAKESNHFVYRKALCAKNYRIKIFRLNILNYF